MANIRFVKPPNDNRIRALPGTVMINDVINIASSAKTDVVCISAPKMNNIVHVTTPKRTVGNNVIADIFTNKKNNGQSQVTYSTANSDQRQNNGRSDYNDNVGGTNANFQISKNVSLQNCYSNFQSDSNQRVFEEFTNSNSVSFSDNDQNFNTLTSKTERNDNQFEAIFMQSNENLFAEEIVSENHLGTGDISEKILDFNYFSEKTAYAHINKCEATTGHAFMSVESPQNGDEAKCPIMNIYTYGTVSEGELSDVLDEELDQLPEISQPGSVASPNVTQQAKPRVQQQQNKPNSPEANQHQHSPLSSSRQQQNRQAPHPSDSGSGYKHPGTIRPIHRSISDIGLVDNGKDPSFFRSIYDVEFQELDKNEPLNIDEMGTRMVEIDDATNITEYHKFTQPAKIAWDSRMSNHRFNHSLDSTTNKVMSAEKSALSKFGESHFMMSRSLSRDSAINDRLKMRRCALADPENMIMRQEVREKIEREVEKRRTSMVRKISQFFNVHLNLNKEEDLI